MLLKVYFSYLSFLCYERSKSVGLGWSLRVWSLSDKLSDPVNAGGLGTAPGERRNQVERGLGVLLTAEPINLANG